MIKPPVRNKPSVTPSGKPPAPSAKQQVVTPTKKFSVSTWEGNKKGKRIIVYADSGMGKTTLCAMLPNPKFADFRGGSDAILHPVTGERLCYIPGVKTFDDVRAVCCQSELLVPGDSLVVDTGTAFEDEALTWTLGNIPHETGTRKINRIEDYGWGKGYRHLYDTMRLPLADFDCLINRGVNVVISCQMQQIEISHAGGENFWCDVPKLQVAHGKNNNVPPVWGLYIEWADEVYKIRYEQLAVKDGKAAGTNDRVIAVQGEPHFKAKSRTIPYQYPVVSFSHPGDDSIWQFLFNEAWKNLES